MTQAGIATNAASHHLRRTLQLRLRQPLSPTSPDGKGACRFPRQPATRGREQVLNIKDIHIETHRLFLRVPRIEDFDRYAELLADEVACRYIGGHMPRAAAWRRFLQMPGAWTVQGFAMFSVLEKSSGRWLGQAGPWKPEGWPGNEVGWSFHPDAWGRGYATEAAAAAIDWAFDNLDWDAVIHCIDPANAPSQALARRLGSRNQGPGKMPAPYEDAPTDIWGQTRMEWAENRKRFA